MEFFLKAFSHHFCLHGTSKQMDSGQLLKEAKRVKRKIIKQKEKKKDYKTEREKERL
jgi:tRNA uridine 5-carbamoylmethylation protein Kti12